jgi:Zn-dependent protease with chaperone function
MGYLLHILAALLAQGLAESGWTTGWRAPWAVPLLLVVPHALGLASHRAFLAGRFRASSLFLRALTACAPVLHLAALCALGWMDFTREQIGASASLDEWPRLGMLLALAPFVVFEAAAIDARARLVAPYPRERAAWRKFQVRMLLSAIVPLVAYLLLTSAVGANRTLRVEIEEVRLYGAAFALAMVLCLALALPTLLRNVWDTAPIPPGVQRDVLSAVAARAGFRARSLLAWNTGDLMANAAIVGIGARTRIVLFSDSLLSQLDHPELAAVFAHEIGHAARRHVLHFVAWAVGFFLLADLVASRLFAEQLWLGGGFLLAAVAIWLLVFGYVSRRFELEADLFCIDLLGDASALIRALEKVGGHIRDVASWRHFSTAERVRFLADAATDPRAQARLRRTCGSGSASASSSWWRRPRSRSGRSSGPSARTGCAPTCASATTARRWRAPARRGTSTRRSSTSRSAPRSSGWTRPASPRSPRARGRAWRAGTWPGRWPGSSWGRCAATPSSRRSTARSGRWPTGKRRPARSWRRPNWRRGARRSIPPRAVSRTRGRGSVPQAALADVGAGLALAQEAPLDDLAEDRDVVARLELAGHPAIEPRQRAGEHRGSRCRAFEGQPVERGGRLRELPQERRHEGPAAGVEDRKGEMTRSPQVRQMGSGLADRDAQGRRLEPHLHHERPEEPDRTPVPVRRHDEQAGGDAAERARERGRLEVRHDPSRH